jgi:hypothetical protein
MKHTIHPCPTTHLQHGCQYLVQLERHASTPAGMQVAAAAGAASSAGQLPHCICHVLRAAPLLQQRLKALGQRPGNEQTMRRQ